MPSFIWIGFCYPSSDVHLIWFCLEAIQSLDGETDIKLRVLCMIKWIELKIKKKKKQKTKKNNDKLQTYFGGIE